MREFVERKGEAEGDSGSNLYSVEADSVYIRNISLLSTNKYFLMYLRGQMNLRVFLKAKILKMNEKYSVKTFDSVQFLGLTKGKNEIDFEDFCNVSLKTRKKINEPGEGKPFFGLIFQRKKWFLFTLKNRKIFFLIRRSY